MIKVLLSSLLFMLDYFKAWFRIIAFLFFDVLVGEPVACMFPVSFPCSVAIRKSKSNISLIADDRESSNRG